MSTNRRTQKKGTWIIALMCVTFASVILIACSTTSTPTPQSTDAVTSNSANPTLQPAQTSTPTGKDIYNTRVAQHLEAIATDAALSPHPTPPQDPIYLESPIPTATWATGYGGGLDQIHATDPEYNSCWGGYLGVNLLEVCLGHEYPDKEYGGDRNQGLLLVQVFAPDRTNVRGDVYETPGAFGSMHFIAANSSSVTIASEDGQHVFTFDIASSQWVPDPPSVLLTVTPSPQK